MIGRAALAVAVAMTAAAAPATGGALRRHRLILPTPPLPRSLTVDESEWQIIPSERVVAAGTVTMQVYDRGQDAHNLTVQGPITSSGDGKIRGQVWLQSGGATTLVEPLGATLIGQRRDDQRGRRRALTKYLCFRWRAQPKKLARGTDWQTNLPKVSRRASPLPPRRRSCNRSRLPS